MRRIPASERSRVMPSWKRAASGRTLAQLLMVAFFLLSFAVLVFAGSLQLVAHFEAEKRALYANQQLVAEGASREVSGFILAKCRVLATAAWLTNPDRSVPEEWELLLQHLLGLESAFRLVAVSEPDGRIVALASRDSPGPSNAGAAESPSRRFTARPDPESGAFISNVYIDPVTSEPLVSVRVPVWNALREHRKTLTAELNLKSMWDLVDGLRVGDEGYVYVIDDQGKLLAFGDTARVLRGENVSHLPTVAEFVRAPARRTSAVRLYRGIDGRLVVGTYAPTTTPSWAIVTERPFVEAFRGLIVTTLIALGIVTAMAAVAAVAGRAISRRLAVPLVGLKETATRIAGGERSLQAAVDGPLEVVELATAFNSMSSQLGRSLAELEAQVAAVRLAHDALEASEERLRLAQEGTSDAIWDLEIAENRLHLSPRFYRMLGYEPGEFPPTVESWLERLHPDDSSRTQAAVEAALSSGDPLAIEWRIMAKDGRWRWILSRGKAVASDPHGRPLRFAGSHSDVTERREAEAQRAALEAKLLEAQKMEAIALLAGGVAHDFNNMLSVILGRAQLALMRLSPDDPFHAAFTEIVMAGERSAELTRQLLAFARRQPIAPRALDLNAAVSRLLKLLRRIAGENVDLRFRPQAGLWTVRMDPVQVDQLVANLVVNARDAIADVGHVTIETRNVTYTAEDGARHPGLTPGEYVVLAVSDSGCGMDESTLAHIFDPFFTTKQLGKGTGLGLATVHGIVKQNAGFISVRSTPGSGTTFTISLPCHRAVSTPEEPQAEPALAGGDERVLLVEDDPTLRDVATAMLEQLGYRVLAASGPAAALACAHAHEGPIDVVLTDVVMPGMNGRDFATRLAATRPNARCLFMSGYTASAIVDRGELEQGLHFLAKPFSLQQLAAAMRRVLADPSAAAASLPAREGRSTLPRG